MGRKIFVNLGVKDLNKSVEFFTKLGFTFNPQFTDENATMMNAAEDIHVMLVVEHYFKTFTTKEVADAHTVSEALIAFSSPNKEEVDAIFNKAIEAGAKPNIEAVDHGFMYGRSFQDLDGHIWEFFWMDPVSMEEK